MSNSPDHTQAQTDRIGEALHELADDTLHVLQRMTAFERQLQELAAAISDSDARHHQLIEQLRQDSIGARRGLVVRSLFESVVTALDSLDILARAGALDAEALQHQVQATGSVLQALLASQGFTRFEAAAGDAFQPARMQVVGYAEGPPGVVLRNVQPGYLVNETVIRPAGVLIADPTASGQHTTRED